MAQVDELESKLKALSLGPVHPKRLGPATDAVVEARLATLVRNLFGVYHPLPLGPDAVVSGSALLAALLDKPDWNPNDLDIVCRPTAVPRLRDYFMRHGFTLVLVKSWNYIGTHALTVEMWAPGSSVMAEASPDTFHRMNQASIAAGLPPLDPRTRGRWGNSCIQLVIEHDPTLPLVFGRYDLHVLENTFDGHSVLVNYPSHVKLCTSTLAHLPPRKSVYYWDHVRRRESRIEKYASRGIRIIQ